MRTKINWLFLFISSLFFSCTDNQDIIDTETDPNYPKIEIINGLMSRAIAINDSLGSTDFLLGCYQIQFPFSFVTTNNTEILINQESDLNNLFTNSQDTIVDFKYPITLVNDLGESMVVNNLDEMVAAFASCPTDFGNEGGLFAYHINFDNSCYQLTFPITIVKANTSNQIVVNNGTELDQLLAQDAYYFSFPLSLSKEDGTNTTVQNEDELLQTLAGCCDLGGGLIDSFSIEFGIFACYDAQYPFSIKLNNGNTTEVANEEELMSFVFQGLIEGFIYPLTLVDENNINHITNNDQELFSLIDNCFNVVTQGEIEKLIFISSFPDSLGISPCVEIIFPIQLSVPNATVSVNNYNEFLSTAQQNIMNTYLVYPFMVKIIESNEIKNVENEDDLDEIFLNCR
jgi:hypothetical protein